MPTYAQLQAEPWWDREVITPELDWLGDELCRRTSRPRTAAGTKGDNKHLRGAHRSQEWILRSAFCTNRTYTVQSGLTTEQVRHIAGFDFTPGSVEQMIAQCKRLDAALRAGRLEEVREFYGNTDGDQVVDGWNNLQNRAATSDNSHLWHWHLTIDRRHLRNKPLMERILRIALALPEPEEDDMANVNQADWDNLIWRVEAIMNMRDTVVGGPSKGQAVSVVRAIKALQTGAAADATRDAATAVKLAELAELVRAGQSGQLDANEVLRRMGELLSAAAPTAQN